VGSKKRAAAGAGNAKAASGAWHTNPAVLKFMEEDVVVWQRRQELEAAQEALRNIKGTLDGY
jgi:hypothetical protein